MKRTPGLAFTASLAVLTTLLPASAWPAVVTVADTGPGWELRIDGQPFFVRGIGYTPEKAGEDPNVATLRNWMFVDDNGNGRADAPYDSFVDANLNNVRDASEPVIGDWQLLADMGVNTIRVYHHPSDDASVQDGYGGTSTRLQYNHAPNKQIFRDLFETYGIRTAMGDFFGAYTVGSGASATTAYANATHRARILASVRQMVEDFKDEEWLLMYVLGNENNYDGLTQGDANAQPAAFASLVGEAVDLIKSLDPNHPVVICLGDDGDNVTAQLAALPGASQPDIIGTNVYRQPDFQDIFTIYAGLWDKPVLFTEYGDPSTQFIGGDIDQARQTSVYTEALDDMEANRNGSGTQSAVGGFAFTWLDNFWQSGGPSEHTINTTAPGDFENEWHGFAAQGNGARSLFLRQLRQVYFDHQARWRPGGHPVSAAGGSAVFNMTAGPAIVSYGAGAFPAGSTLTMVETGAFPDAADSALDMTPTGSGFNLSEASGNQPSSAVTVSFPYAHGGAGLVLARYDADRNAWVPLATSRASSGALVARTTHLSLFQVMQAVASPTVDNAVVFPNPARPAWGHTGMTFTQLPPGSAVKLFTPAGEMIRELSADAAGVAEWDLRNRDGRDAASGVYFAFLDGSGGTRTMKVAVQR